MEDVLKNTLYWSSSFMELAGILIIVTGLAIVSVKYVSYFIKNENNTLADFKDYRHSIGRVILLGLEFLLAADIIATVGVHSSWNSIGILGIIVLIRTFLSFSLEVEISGQWPWRRSTQKRQSSS